MEKDEAVLLLAHGTPDVLGEMAEYLGKVTGGRALPQEVVEELQHRYAEIGLREEPIPGGPPLTKWTLEQGRLLGEALGEVLRRHGAKPAAVIGQSLGEPASAYFAGGLSLEDATRVICSRSHRSSQFAASNG